MPNLILQGDGFIYHGFDLLGESSLAIDHSTTPGREASEQSKGDGRNHEQVRRRDAVSVTAQERPPALGRRPSTLCHVFGDRCLPGIDAELEEFTVDARCAPERVRNAHVANELSDLRWRPRPTTVRSRFPAPIGSETSAMPTDHRLGLDDF